MTGRIIGTVASLHRYPVKSMAGERLDAAALHWTGLAGDREWAFCRSADRSDFPWLTGRQIPSLPSFRPRRAPGEGRPQRMLVDLPNGVELGLDGAALLGRLAEDAGEPIHLLRLGRGAFDAMPISVITTAELDRLDRVFGAPLDARRFRFNLVVHGTEEIADWSGRRLSIGDAELTVCGMIPRCAMITLDPDTGERDPSIMRLVAQDFANELGAYCAPSRPGTIRVGDAVGLVD